jgi:MFS family permease
VVQNLGLTAGEYGLVVSAFALAKMVGNIPFAVLVERHGRKPYLVYSMIIISAGVGAIGLATNFESLYVCRLLTGMGVAGLSTAVTMTVADISTPLNRASTYAPIVSSDMLGCYCQKIMHASIWFFSHTLLRH